MNIITGIMLLFAILGFADKTFSLRWGLNEVFDKGLATMGTMVIPIVGVCTVGVEFIERNKDFFLGLSDILPFDPSLIIGVLLAPDLGGYFVTKALTDSHDLLIINGVVLGTLLGQAIGFQLPIFFATIDKSDKPLMLKAFLVGISVIPAGMLVAQLILRMDMGIFMRQFTPVLLMCLLVAFGLYKAPDAMVKGFMIVGKIIQIATNLMFAIAMVGVFVPALRFADMDSVKDALLILFKSAVIIGGALVLAELSLRLFRKRIQSLANRIGTNEVSVVCILMGCATSLAILPLFGRMDDKGKMLNSAFSISGAYVIGGSMAFVSAVESGYVMLIFFASKLLSGALSMLIMNKLHDAEKKRDS